MSDLRKAAEMALEASKKGCHEMAQMLLEAALRQALAQPEQESDWKAISEEQLKAAKTAMGKTLEDAAVHAIHKLYNTPSEQEPVAWMSDHDVDFKKSSFGTYPCVPLYTAPPKREWVGLTDEERERATGWSVEHIESYLKEKNT